MSVPTKASATLSKPLSAGWTWFSINVQGADMTVNNVLRSLNPNNWDYIKNLIQADQNIHDSI